MNSDPIDAGAYAWPQAEVGVVDKMRAIAAALPHVCVRETFFEAEFDDFWSFVSDLEGSVPYIELAVSALKVVDRRDDRLRVESRSPLGFWMDSDVVLRPGWCLMRSKWSDVGMAAQAEGPGRTRYLHFEGLRVDSMPILGRLFRPVWNWNIGRDFRRLEMHFSE